MSRRAILAAFLALAGALGLWAQEGIAPGDWVGTLMLRQATQTPSAGQSLSQPGTAGQGASPETYSFEFAIHLLRDDRGVTVDIPEQGMFSYPIDRYSFSEAQISLVLDTMGDGEELTLTGNYSSGFVPQGKSQKGGIVGAVKGRSWTGSFYAQRQDIPALPGEVALNIPVEGGSLPATLTVPLRAAPALDPKSPQQFPLVVLVAGAGRTDRNGNNVDVPGKTDTLKQLAQMLRQRGVGSIRFDKRGTGEAYKLEKPGQMTSFTQHVKDIAQVISSVSALPREGRLIVAGMNEGAWQASAALAQLSTDTEVDGFVVLDASGVGPMETLAQSVENLPPDLKATALEAAHALVSSGKLIDVPQELANFFSPNRTAWLATWLAFDPVAALRAVRIPILLVYGTRDMQVDRAAFGKLVEAAPNAGVRVVPDMNYALKIVHSDDENYAAFTDPSFKVPPALADLLAAYAKALPSPDGLLPWNP